jgi:hypothetical protein
LKIRDGGLPIIADLHMDLVIPADGPIMHDVTQKIRLRIRVPGQGNLRCLSALR